MQRAKIVAVYSGSGGAGKSLLAANLAVSLQLQDSGRVLFVDAGHPIPGDAIALVGLERAKSLGEMAPILNRLTPEIFASYLLRAPSGLSVLPLVGDVLQARQVTPELLA
jgi:pilus assembly protein CpaE